VLAGNPPTVVLLSLPSQLYDGAGALVHICARSWPCDLHTTGVNFVAAHPEFRLIDELLVQDRSWRSLRCTKPDCCPGTGNALPLRPVTT
jgi:hypothetical protein